MELRIREDSIDYVKIYDSERTYYSYLPEKQEKWFFGLIPWEYYPSGYYKYSRYKKQMGMLLDYYSEKEISQGDRYTVVGQRVYIKPGISIFTKNECIKTKYFHTLEQAKRYCNENFPNLKVIINE